MSKDPQSEIFRTMPGDGSAEWEETFYGCLSEHGNWDMEKFWIFHMALTEIGKEVQEDAVVDRKLVYALLYIQQHVLTHVTSHYNSQVDWKFEAIDDEQLFEFVERFELAILGAISGEVSAESSFDLVNPLLADA